MSFRLDIAKYNNTLDNIKAEFSDFFHNPILTNPSEWEMSIDRFRVPLTNIPCYKVLENSNHWIRIEANDVITASGASYEPLDYRTCHCPQCIHIVHLLTLLNRSIGHFPLHIRILLIHHTHHSFQR